MYVLLARALAYSNVAFWSVTAGLLCAPCKTVCCAYVSA